VPGGEVKTTTARIDWTCATNTCHGLSLLAAAVVVVPYDREDADELTLAAGSFT